MVMVARDTLAATIMTNDRKCKPTSVVETSKRTSMEFMNAVLTTKNQPRYIRGKER